VNSGVGADATSTAVGEADGEVADDGAAVPPVPHPAMTTHIAAKKHGR